MFRSQNRPPLHHAAEDRLSFYDRRSLYEAASHRIRADRGTPYPCSQENIDKYCRRGHPDTHARYITPNSATNELTRWLDQEPDPEANIALNRLSEGIKIMPWGPDLAIKALRDLDTAFFMGTLRGNVKVSWRGRFKWKRKFMIGNNDCFAITEKGGHAQSGIYLNANKIFVNEVQSPFPFRQMWCTLLHEMVHAYLDVKCGHYHNLSGDPTTGTWSGGHGTHFRRCLDMVNRRAIAYLGVEAMNAEWEKFDDHD